MRRAVFGRLRTVVAAMLMAAGTMVGAQTWAQEPTVSFGEPGRGVARSGAIRVLGSDGTHVAYLATAGSMVPSLELRSYDMGQQETGNCRLSKMNIRGDYEVMCMVAMVNGDKLDLVLSQDKDGESTLTHERRDLATLALEGEARTLASIASGKKDRVFFFTATSPDEKLVAVATAKVEAGLGAEVRVSLYSRTMEEYWSMDVPAHGFSDMLVNNDGEVVLVGLGDKDGRGTVQATVVDGERTEHQDYTYDLGGTLVEWAPARYAAGKLLLVATMRAETRVIMHVGSNIDCVDALTCDLTDGTMQVSRKQFSDAELARMENTRGTSTRYHWMDFGTLQQVLPDDEGAFVVVDNEWGTYNQYGALLQTERRGMMVLRVDAEGRFAWTHTERTYVKAKSNLKSWTAYRWVPTEEGIMLAWTTNPKDATQGEDKNVRGLTATSGKAELSVLRLDRAGNATKSRFYLGKQTLMLYPTPLPGGEWLIFASDKKNGMFGKIKTGRQ